MSYFDVPASTDLQDETHRESNPSGPSIGGEQPTSIHFEPLFCHKPGCEHLSFASEVQHRNHILTHITLPKVLVQRLDNEIVKKVTKRSAERQTSLKVRLKLTSSAGSSKPAFENIVAGGIEKNLKSSAVQRFDFLSFNFLNQRDTHWVEVVKETNKFLSGPGGLFCPDGEVKPEFFENYPSTQQARSSSRRPETSVELDYSTESLSSKERGETSHDTEQDEEDRFEDDIEEDEEEEDDDDEDRDVPERSSAANRVPASAPCSPTPSEVLRPHGYLAPDTLADDDSCYQGSPPNSPPPPRMVEMNGSTSAVGGSDNDSGHSRSPAPFSGGGSGGGDEDASASINWDELVGASIGHDTGGDGAGANENGQSDGSPGDNSNDDSSDHGANNILDTDPLMLSDNQASAEGEQENLSLLQDLAAEPLQPEVDRGTAGDTEYMSLDRLGEPSFSCDVCGERTQDRRVLEEHRAMAGHYKCLILPECGATVWTTQAELAAHQSTMHNVQPAHPIAASPRTSPQTAAGPGPGTPPVQQLAQQVQRIPVPPQAGYSGAPQYPGTQQPMPPQMGPMMPQMMPGPGQMPQRRPPANYRMPMAPYGPGQGPPPNQGFVGIQPRPLNTMVASQQQPRGPMPQGRMPPGMGGRGMMPMPMRGQKRPGPVPGAPRGPMSKQRRVEGMLPPPQDNGPPKQGSDANAVANILATRGITVTPAGGGAAGPGAGRGGVAPSAPRQRHNMHAPPAPPAPAPVTTLNLNSAISIIPTSGGGNGRQQVQNNSGFAVPQVRALGRQPVTNAIMDRPPRPPTVDLTGDGPVPPPGSTRLQMGPSFHRGRGRPSNTSRLACQICDKAFASHEMLQQHMVMHRGPGKLPYRCNLCNAQYPTSQGLQQHRQTYHKEAAGMSAPLAPGEEMVIPLIDLKQPGVAARLTSLGIHHCIPLSGLGNQANGYFSLPVVSIDGSRPGAAGNLRSLGASGVLSIGPIKLVPK